MTTPDPRTDLAGYLGLTDERPLATSSLGRCGSNWRPTMPDPRVRTPTTDPIRLCGHCHLFHRVSEGCYRTWRWPRG